MRNDPKKVRKHALFLGRMCMYGGMAAREGVPTETAEARTQSLADETIRILNLFAVDLGQWRSSLVDVIKSYRDDSPEAPGRLVELLKSLGWWSHLRVT